MGKKQISFVTTEEDIIKGHMSNNQWNDALEACDSLIESVPTSVSAYGLRAKILSQMNRFEEVDEAYKTAIEKNPGDVNLNESYADTLFRMNRFVEAEEYYRSSRDSLQVLKKRAKTLYRINRFSEALEIYQDICRRNPSDGKAYKKAADILKKMKRPLETSQADLKAVENFKIKLLEIPEGKTEFAYEETPKDVSLLLKMAATCQSLERYDDALRYFKEAAEINPYDEKVHKKIGDVYAKMKRYEDASKAYKKSFKVNPYYIKGMYSYINNFYFMLIKAVESPEGADEVKFEEIGELYESEVEKFAEFALQSFSTDNIWAETLLNKLLSNFKYAGDVFPGRVLFYNPDVDRYMIDQCDNILEPLLWETEEEFRRNVQWDQVLRVAQWLKYYNGPRTLSFLESVAYYKLEEYEKGEEWINQVIDYYDYFYDDDDDAVFFRILKGCMFLKKGDETKLIEAEDLIKNGINNVNLNAGTSQIMIQVTLEVLCENHRFEDADAFLEKGTEEKQKQFKDVLEGLKKEFGGGYSSEDEAEEAGSELEEDKAKRNIGEKNKRPETEGLQREWDKRRKDNENDEAAQPRAKPGGGKLI